MATPLLKTKVQIAPARSELVPRRRILERLNACLRAQCFEATPGSVRKLTLLSVPSGSSKSAQTTRYFAWVHTETGLTLCPCQGMKAA